MTRKTAHALSTETLSYAYRLPLRVRLAPNRTVPLKRKLLHLTFLVRKRQWNGLLQNGRDAHRLAGTGDELEGGDGM